MWLGEVGGGEYRGAGHILQWVGGRWVGWLGRGRVAGSVGASRVTTSADGKDYRRQRSQLPYLTAHFSAVGTELGTPRRGAFKAGAEAHSCACRDGEGDHRTRMKLRGKVTGVNKPIDDMETVLYGATSLCLYKGE